MFRNLRFRIGVIHFLWSSKLPEPDTDSPLSDKHLSVDELEGCIHNHGFIDTTFRGATTVISGVACRDTTETGSPSKRSDTRCKTLCESYR